jgi:hypothetical protein
MVVIGKTKQLLIAELNFLGVQFTFIPFKKK